MRTHPDPLAVRRDALTTLDLTASPADMAESGYLHVPLDLPDGLGRIEVTLGYDEGPDRLIDLGLLDPAAGPFPTREGFRGWSGGAREGFTVGLHEATPGYVAGPLPAGRWHVILGLVRLPGPTPVRLTALGGDDPGVPAQVARVPNPARPGPLWARGDCQCHTLHSDAKGLPETLHAQALAAGLDFLFVTDHNTMTAWDAHFAAASSPGLVFLPGIEVTTPMGHGNALGVERWVDFRLEAPGDPQRLVEEVHAAGGLFSINHDKPDIPWRWPVPAIDAMEVWQSGWLAANEVSLARYDARLAGGRRITAIGGSDWHQPAEVSGAPFGLGAPSTVLHVRALSRAGVMDALRRGEGYVTEAPGGPSLVTTVDGAPMGGVLPLGRGLRAETTGADGDALVLVSRGEAIARTVIPPGGVVEVDLPQGLPHVRAEIEAVASRDSLVAAMRDRLADRPRAVPRILRALGNPHYFGDWT